VIKYWVLCLMALTFGVNNVFAQEKWVPRSIYVQAPIEATHSIVGDCQYGPNDTSWKENTIMYVGSYTPSFSNPTNYHRTNNTISMSWQDGLGTYDLSFIFDSLHNTLNNYSVHFAGSGPPFGYGNATILLSSISFISSQDSFIEVNMSGANLINSISISSFDNGRSNNCTGGHYNEGISFDHIIFDTSSYQCIITLVIPQTSTSVQVLNNIALTFMVSTSLPDHTIHFSFPITDHAKEMTIYDILGREVSRIEIPAGSASYVMSSVGFTKATYFARLGLQTASFIVQNP